MERREGPVRLRQPVRSGDDRRADLGPAPGQQLLHLSRCRARHDRRPFAPRHRRDVPRRGDGAGRAGDGAGPRRRAASSRPSRRFARCRRTSPSRWPKSPSARATPASSAPPTCSRTCARACTTPRTRATSDGGGKGSRDAADPDSRPRWPGRRHGSRDALDRRLRAGPPCAGLPELRVGTYRRTGGRLLPDRRPRDPAARADPCPRRADRAGPDPAAPGRRVPRPSARRLRAHQQQAQLRRARPRRDRRALPPGAAHHRAGHRDRAQAPVPAVAERGAARRICRALRPDHPRCGVARHSRQVRRQGRRRQRRRRQPRLSTAVRQQLEATAHAEAD